MSGKSSQAKAAKAMKEELLKWICMTHASNTPLDRVLLREKALQFVCFFGLTGFKCSEAWLTVFLKRHGFSPSLTDCCGPVFEDYRVWIDLIRPLFMELSYEDQFHVDELMMYTDFLPTLTQRPEAVDDPGSSNESQQTVQQYSSIMPRGIACTLLLASNSSGTEKLRPLISAPYTYENNRKDCIYHRDENAKISDELFGGWLTNLNREMASNNRRIVVLLSRKRIGSLRYAQLTHIMTLFFPNEFPTHLRPLRRDVFHYVKMIYRTKYVKRLCEASPKAFWQPEEIVETLVQAWRQVPRELIIASFQRTKFREDNSLLSIECASWDDLRIGMSFRRFVVFDDDISDAPVLRLDPGFVISINKSKCSFRDSENEEVSKLNDVEDQSDSSRELESSLKRPSDDSINISSELQDHNQEDVTSDSPEMSKIPGTSIGDSEQFFSARDTDEGQDKEEKNVVKDEGKTEDVLNDVMDSVLDRAKSCSPTRDASTPIRKVYDKGLINRVYPSPERTSSLQLCSVFVTEQCFEEVSKSLENKLMDLEKSCSSGSYEDLPRKQLENLFDDTPIASTSKEGLDESYILQQIDRRLAEGGFQVNLEQSLNVEENNLCQMVKIKEEFGGSGDDYCRVSKRRRDEGDIEESNDDDDDEKNSEEGPLEKRPKTEETNWAKRYEKQLVFGPDNLDPCEEANEEPGDHLADMVQSQMEQSSNPEIEKKCIFTFSENTAGPSGSCGQ